MSTPSKEQTFYGVRMNPKTGRMQLYRAKGYESSTITTNDGGHLVLFHAETPLGTVTNKASTSKKVSQTAEAALRNHVLERKETIKRLQQAMEHAERDLAKARALYTRTTKQPAP